MPKYLRYLPSAGALAVYSTSSPSTDNDPLTDPLDHLDVIDFHSGLRYPAIIPAKIVTGSSTIPAQDGNDYFSGSIDIYEHGMGDVPVVIGKITSVETDPDVAGGDYVTIGTPVPWCGSVPLLYKTGASESGNRRPWTTWAHLAATDTHVILRYFGMTGVLRPHGDIDIDWKIYVMDTTIDNGLFAGDPTKPMLELLGDRITAGQRKFDTDRGYLRLGAGLDQNVLPKGETMVINGIPDREDLDEVDNDWGWRWSVAGVTIWAGYGGAGTFEAEYDTAGF